MGDSIEQWRATIGQWSGGRPRNCVTSQYHIAQTSNQIGYKQIRFLVLLSLLVIGCVELNPGPDHGTSATTQSAGNLPQYPKQPGTYGLHGGLYEVKMAAFLFARALNKTDEFQLASNVAGLRPFDDLVLRYRLRNDWKICFIQLTHNENGDPIERSSLTQMPPKKDGHFCLIKYFISYCKIKNRHATDNILQACGPFVDFEFVIYTNRKMESKSPLQGGDSDPLSILSSRTDCEKYIAFDKKSDKDIFEFFKELSDNKKLIAELDSLLKGRNSDPEEKKKKINALRISVKNKSILNHLEKIEKGDKAPTWIHEVVECDFTLFKEFLEKFKIFQDQSNEQSLKELIEKELQEACKASPSVASFIYPIFEEGFHKLFRQKGNVSWLNEKSELWEKVEKHITDKIEEMSKPETQKILGCDISFTEQHIQNLSHDIKQNTVLNIVTNSNNCILQKLKTYQALKNLGYVNSLFIGIEFLRIPHKEIHNLWPCKYSDVLVVDCGSDSNVALTALDILQQSAHDEEANMVDGLQKYQQKVILISTPKLDSVFQDKLGNISKYDKNCKFSDLSDKSQKLILERPINFQGKEVILSALVGTYPSENIKVLLDSDVISILLSNKLSVGRDLDAERKDYIPRVLQHQISLKKDILERTDYKVTFAVSGLQAEELKSYLPAGEKIYELVNDETERIHTFSIVTDFSKNGLTAQNVKPEEVRYIILGNNDPVSEFRKTKELCSNVHWIHVEEGSFLWKGSNCNIDVIRKYIDNTKPAKDYDMESVVKHKDRTNILVAEPGMGKSTFLTHMAHEINELNPSVWILRINLNKHTKELEDTDFKHENIEECKAFLWKAAHSQYPDALEVTKEMFSQALEQTGKMVLILDGFDEISPDYSRKVEIIIRVIRDKTASNIWISSRVSCRCELEDIVGKFAFTLQPFTQENQKQFLEKYWRILSEICKTENLQSFAKILLDLCSKNFSDKDREFAGIPLQTMMLGEAFFNEAKQYCCSGEIKLEEKFNLLDLFQTFTDKKIQIYFEVTNEMDTSNLEVKRIMKDYLEKHKISALLHLFSQKEINELLGKINASNLEQTKCFLREGQAQKLGIILEYADEKPHFVHRCFPEYLAAKWLTDNFRNCQEFISKVFFASTYEVTRNFFDRILAKDSDIHDSVLKNDAHALKELLKKGTDINTSDNGGRTALHLAASYNSPCTQELLSFPGIFTEITDAILKWTPLKYADRTKSWMAMDILLENDANPDDIVFTRQNAKAQEWGQRALWECASKGHITLMEFMLNCGLDLNAHLDVPENLNEKCTLLHRASCCKQVKIVRLIVNRGADINIRDASNNTALHYAAQSGSVDIIKLLVGKGMSVNLNNTNNSTPLHISAEFGHLEATNALVERGAALNKPNKYGNTPLMLAAHKSKIELFRYLTEKGADINICNDDNNTVLHLASACGSLDIMKILLDKGVSVNLTNEHKFTPLHISARFGHLEITKALIEEGATLNNTNIYGHTPLMVAAFNDKFDICCYLTENGADINFRNIKNNTAIRYAAYSGNVHIINLLLDEGMSVNETDEKGSTPLHVTAQFGHLEATKLLFKRGAALNHKNKYGNTPLMIAAYKCKLETFRYLTEIRADINIRDPNNNTALHYAAESGCVDIIKFLLVKGMSVNLTDTGDSTPLHVSAYFGNLEATKTLVERGAAINDTNKYGRTPLLMAAYTGKLEIFRYLTEVGVDINIRDSRKNTALHIASFSGCVDIIKSLLDKGMFVNSNNTNEFTPLHVSAEFGHLEATKTLVERGATITNTNKYGDTPLMLAAYKGKLDIFRYLTEIGAKINIRDANNNTALHFASASGNVDIIKSLLDEGMSVNLTNIDEFTPLHISAHFGHLEATKTLVERGAAITNTNKYGDTPLMLAAYKGKLEIFRYLTEIGAEINIRDANNNTALHFASASGNVDIIKSLLDNGMSVNLINTDDSTPLHVSAEFGHLESTKLLVERDAAINKTNKYGNTPLMLALYNDKLELCRYLTGIGADINICGFHNNY